MGPHHAERSRWHLVLEAGEDAHVLFRHEVGAAADSLTDFNHQTLEAQHAVVEPVGATEVMQAEPPVILVFGEPLPFRSEAPVAQENAGGDVSGVSEAEQPYLPKSDHTGTSRCVMISLRP